MTAIPRSYKIFYGVICAAALLIGFLGYFAPARLAEITSWLTLPPLHARFVGALYFYGAVFMASCMLARQHAEVRYAMPMITIWTGLLFVISILSLSAFDLTLLPPWIWFASYLIYPLIALWFTWKQRRMDNNLSGEPLPNWAKYFLLAQGIVVGLFALALEDHASARTNVWRSIACLCHRQLDVCPTRHMEGGANRRASHVCFRRFGIAGFDHPSRSLFDERVERFDLVHCFRCGDCFPWVDYSSCFDRKIAIS